MNSITPSISPHNVNTANNSTSSSTSHQLASLVAAAAASYGNGGGSGGIVNPGVDSTANGMPHLSAAALIKDKIQDLFEQAKRLEEEKQRRQRQQAAEEEQQQQLQLQVGLEKS